MIKPVGVVVVISLFRSEAEVFLGLLSLVGFPLSGALGWKFENDSLLWDEDGKGRHRVAPVGYVLVPQEKVNSSCR